MKHLFKLMLLSLTFCLKIANAHYSNDIGHEGTIGVTYQTENPKKTRSYIYEPGIWNHNNLTVCWVNPEATTVATKHQIRDIIRDTWGKVTLLTFEGWDDVCTDANVDIRIKVEDTLMAPRTITLGKTYGWYQGGDVIINTEFKHWYPECLSRYGLDACIKTVVVHEFGHILSYAHEDARTDKPNYCTSYPYEFNGTSTYSKYDIKSVMAYCNPVWAGLGVLSYGDTMAGSVFYGNIAEYNAVTEELHLTNVDNKWDVILKKIPDADIFYIVKSEENAKASLQVSTFYQGIVKVPMVKVTVNGEVKKVLSGELTQIMNGYFKVTRTDIIE